MHGVRRRRPGLLPRRELSVGPGLPDQRRCRRQRVRGRGAAGQPCCAPFGTCQPGFACEGRGPDTAGTCAACGGDGQPCCRGAMACGSPFTCNLGVCGTCGAPNQACCGSGTSGTCSAGLGCTGRNLNVSPQVAGTCGACGGDGQPCCSTGSGAVDAGVSPCTGPLGCVLNPGGNVCRTYGGLRQECCGTSFAGTCTASGLGCIERTFAGGTPGICAACGAAGQPCCSGVVDTCLSGLTCTAMICTGRDAGGQ